jgi:hypothetical protein
VADAGTSDAVDNRELFKKVGLVSDSGEVQRSNPLSSPVDFKELATRLLRIVDQPFDLIVVRDLFGDRVLGYELAQLAGKYALVSYDREGIIALESGRPVERGARALIAADTHFTTQSIQAAASGAEQAGLEIVGAAILLQTVHGEYPFPVWALESSA